MIKAYQVVPLLLILAACAKANSLTPAAAADAMSSRADAPSGVGYVGAGIEPDTTRVIVKEVNPYQPIKIRVTGTGTVPDSRSLSPSQKKLLSVRAAKLDAFRAIAEQVQGMKLVGNSSVANMVSVSDGFRTYVDAYLRGVNIVSTSLMPDGSSEVVAEIVLDKDFYQQFKMALQQTGSVMKAAQQNGAQGAQCGEEGCGSARYNSNFYNAQ